MSFDKLVSDLDELQKLQKSEAADDESLDGSAGGDDDDDEIVAAAADGAGADAQAEPDGDEGDGAIDDDGAEDDASFGKSFRFTLDSGDEVEAVDGTELVKSLMTRVEALEGSGVSAGAEMTKALGVAVDLIKSQGEAISSLRNEVKRLASEGRGRKTVVSVAERPAPESMAKSEPAGVSGEVFMAKALEAQKAGRITALQVSVAEGALTKGLAVPADIVKSVLV